MDQIRSGGASAYRAEPAPAFGTPIVPGDSATGTVTVTMSVLDVNQDACQKGLRSHARARFTGSEEAW